MEVTATPYPLMTNLLACRAEKGFGYGRAGDGNVRSASFKGKTTLGVSVGTPGIMPCSLLSCWESMSGHRSHVSADDVHVLLGLVQGVKP